MNTTVFMGIVNYTDAGTTPIHNTISAGQIAVYYDYI